MKITLVTYGTEGDVRPLAAVCHALDQAGHQTLLLADAGTLASARRLGVATQALAGDIQGGGDASHSIAGVIARSDRPDAAARALVRIANTHAADWLRQTVDASRDAQLVLASGLAGFVGLSAAEALGLPAIGLGMFPLTPTRAFPYPFLPPKAVWPVFNRLSYHVVNGFLWRSFRPALNAARRDVCGLPPRRRMWVDHPVLYGYSPTLLPRPDDWPSQAEVCGQWLAPTPDWTPPQALATFLAVGEPPVYIGFGSMGGFDTARMRDALVAGLEGRRAVFHPGWSGMDTAGLPPSIHVVGDTPHEWLFPRMACVVHHGGSGTTHSAARAGVPSIVVPFAGDQAFWAHRLALQGVAPEAVNGARFGANDLRRGLAFAGRAEVRERAARLGARLRAEDGLACAVAAIGRRMNG